MKKAPTVKKKKKKPTFLDQIKQFKAGGLKKTKVNASRNKPKADQPKQSCVPLHVHVSVMQIMEARRNAMDVDTDSESDWSTSESDDFYSSD